MKLRGALGGLNLLIEAGDTRLSVTESLAPRLGMLNQKVMIELAADADPEAIQAAFAAVLEAGGQLGRVRAGRGDAPRQQSADEQASAEMSTAGTANSAGSIREVAAEAGRLPGKVPDRRAADITRTEIVQHGLRAGFRGEYHGSVVVLGDVNPGAELIADGDVIVMGALRGVVHAGAGGRTDSIVYARPIASAQIRIAGAVARRAEDSSLGGMRRSQERPDAELARLQDGVIQIESHLPQRS